MSDSYLSLPGSGASFASAPHHARMDIAGDIDIRVDIQIASYSAPAAASVWMNKGGSYYLWHKLDGKLYLGCEYADGTFDGGLLVSIVLPFAANTRKKIRVTKSASLGTLRFFHSDDYDPLTRTGTWTQLGGDVAAVAKNLKPSALACEIGRYYTSAFPMAGRFHALEVRSGIDGTVVANPLFATQRPGVSSFGDVQGNTWTVNGAASIVDPTLTGGGGGSAMPWAGQVPMIELGMI